MVDIVEVITPQIVEVNAVSNEIVVQTTTVVGSEVEVLDITSIIEVPVKTVLEVTVGIPGPVGPPGNGSDEMKYTKLTDFVGDDVVYKGEALPGTLESDSAWRISKLAFVGEDVSEKWADGSSDFVKSWANRSSYNYDV